MKKLCCTTSILERTFFYISISESFGWIEPVFLLISPNLKETLRLKEEPSSLLQIKHFEVIKMNDNSYGLHFFSSGKDIFSEDTSNLKIVESQHISREIINNETYSLFNSYYCFKEISNYQEYCFFYQAKGISYLTAFTAFSVDDYVSN